MNDTQDCEPRTWLDSWTAVRSENDSRTIATTRTATGTQCHDSIACGSAHLCQASYSANRPPSEKSTMDTMNAYRYRSRP